MCFPEIPLLGTAWNRSQKPDDKMTAPLVTSPNEKITKLLVASPIDKMTAPLVTSPNEKITKLRR